MNHPGLIQLQPGRFSEPARVDSLRRLSDWTIGQSARFGRKINDGNNERNTLSGSYILQPSISNISLTIGADPTRRKPNGEYGTI